MICPKCGQDTPIQKSFCVNCGGLLETDFGSVQEAVGMEVRDEARRLAGVAADRRAILMPSNRIQPETPWENVVAFAEACRALCHGNSS